MAQHQKQGLDEQVAAVFKEQSFLVRRSTSPIVKAVLGTAPFAGGLASLLGDVAQKRIEIRLRKFLISLAEEVDSLKGTLTGKVDRSFVTTDEFSASLQAVLEEVAHTADQRKESYLREFIIASGLRRRPDISWRDIFLQYLRQLSGAHLSTLSIFYSIQGGLADSDRIGGIEIVGKVPLSLGQIHEQYPEINDTLLKVVCIDLANMGLLVDWRIVAPMQKGYQEMYVISQSGVLFFRFLLYKWD
jgi:hypothetical protein